MWIPIEEEVQLPEEDAALAFPGGIKDMLQFPVLAVILVMNQLASPAFRWLAHSMSSLWATEVAKTAQTVLLLDT